jgi:hypothetical protein
MQKQCIEAYLLYDLGWLLNNFIKLLRSILQLQHHHYKQHHLASCSRCCSRCCSRWCYCCIRLITSRYLLLPNTSRVSLLSAIMLKALVVLLAFVALSMAAVGDAAIMLDSQTAAFPTPLISEKETADLVYW